MLKALTLFISLIVFVNCYSQKLIQVGQRIKFGNQHLKFNDYSSQHKPEDLFHAEIDFQTVATETCLKLSGLKVKEDFKSNYGYSLELGYMFSKEKMTTIFVEGEYEYDHLPIGSSESIEKFNRQIVITNNIEFNYRVSPNMIFSNSLGLRLESKNIYKKNGKVNGLYVESKFQTPIIAKLSYSPQLLLTLSKFSLNFHLTQDIFRFNEVFNRDHPRLYSWGSNAHLSTYTGFGIFFIPHYSIELSEKELLKDD